MCAFGSKSSSKFINIDLSFSIASSASICKKIVTKVLPQSLTLNVNVRSLFSVLPQSSAFFAALFLPAFDGHFFV